MWRTKIYSDTITLECKTWLFQGEKGIVSFPAPLAERPEIKEQANRSVNHFMNNYSIVRRVRDAVFGLKEDLVSIFGDRLTEN